MTLIADFLHLLLDAAPAFAAALLVAAGAVTLTARVGWINRLLTRVGGSLPAATVAGALLPGCAVSTLPLALVLRRHGAGVGTLTAFMVTSAVLGPASVVLTVFMLSWEFALFRLVLPIGAMLILGAGLNAWGRSGGMPLPQSDDAVLEAAKAHRHGGGDGCDGCGDGRPAYWGNLLSMSRTLVPLLLLGLFAAALLRHWLPAEFVEAYLQRGAFAYLAAAAAGIPAYVCEGGEVPLTLALKEFGVGPGPAFTFLQASVGTCLPTMMMAPRIIGRRATVIYVVFWFVFAIGSGWLVQQALG